MVKLQSNSLLKFDKFVMWTDGLQEQKLWTGIKDDLVLKDSI